MKLTVNGKEMDFPGRMLDELIRDLDIKGAKIILEINGDIVSPEQFESTRLHDNDKIEIVRFVGGG